MTFCVTVASRPPHSAGQLMAAHRPDRKSTRLNSSHLVISYAVFCLKKKNTQQLILVHYNITAAEFCLGPTLLIADYTVDLSTIAPIPPYPAILHDMQVYSFAAITAA